MKKTVALILISVLTLCCFSACGGGNGKTDDGKLKIVCTIFPLYDWVRNILGDEADHAELTLLLDSGTDLHSYQPTAGDILTVTGCDLFVYGGGESDEWAASLLAATENPGRRVFRLMDCVPLLEEEGEDGEECHNDDTSQ